MASDTDAEYALLDTNMGRIVVELYTDHAPRTCANFSTLVSKGYYNQVIFHRIIKDFMIQGGDPTGSGRGGESIYGDQPLDDPHPLLKHSGAGIISMANSGPKTEGSQFFITLAPTPWLDGKHIIFGRIKSGMSIVRKIGMVETDGSDKPTTEVKIREAYMLGRDAGLDNETEIEA
ncbi:heme binding [Arthrobotrys musiformis]|uniref:Peptidyl-prolyl cis-trans isomerase n=1 Tax=Arthrobotrys musiformis TaxID=47236 RepID=A0AAV9WP15_9PEZI